MKARSKKMADLPSCIFRHFCIALLFLSTQKQITGNIRIACEELGRREDPTRFTILKHSTSNQKNVFIYKNTNFLKIALLSTKKVMVGKKIQISEDLQRREAQTQLSILSLFDHMIICCKYFFTLPRYI